MLTSRNIPSVRVFPRVLIKLTAPKIEEIPTRWYEKDSKLLLNEGYTIHYGLFVPKYSRILVSHSLSLDLAIHIIQPVIQTLCKVWILLGMFTSTENVGLHRINTNYVSTKSGQTFAQNASSTADILKKADMMCTQQCDQIWRNFATLATFY